MYSFCFQKQIRENLEARQREQQEWDNQQGFAEKPDHGSPGGRSAGRASRDRDSRTKERFVHAFLKVQQ